MEIRVKRVQEHFSRDDGSRVLVDRLWPRGLSRDAARIDLWLKEIAPSDELRKWFAHDPDRFEGFTRRYMKELAARREDLSALRRLAREGTLTLLYAARDERHNNAVVLARVLRRGLPRDAAG